MVRPAPQKKGHDSILLRSRDLFPIDNYSIEITKSKQTGMIMSLWWYTDFSANGEDVIYCEAILINIRYTFACPLDT